MLKRPTLLLLVCTLLVSTQAYAELKVASIFGSHMVLQQREENAIWGWADAGQTVTLTASWLDESVTSVANTDGYWKASLAVPQADLKPHTLTLSAENEIVLTNLLFGEVWICSGQSNMAFEVRGSIGQPMVGSNEAIADGTQPFIRHFQLNKNFSKTPKADCQGEWQEATPQTVPRFTAVGYFFAKRLQASLNVPVGIVHTTWGGTPVEAWMPRQTLEEKFPEIDVPSEETSVNHRSPTVLFNAMIQPLVGLKIKGVLWYQGESNVRHAPKAYLQLFPAMISHWRELWGQGDFAFRYVQICPFEYSDDLQSQLLREAQLKTLDEVPNVGMVATSDLGDRWSIHPKRKREIGERLAYGALNEQYGFKHLQHGGPVYDSMKVSDGVAKLRFKNAPRGLYLSGDQLNDFWIAGEDQLFHRATARIKVESGANNRGKQSFVVVSSEKVATPVAVRYGWSNWFVGTLSDTAGNAASSFRTDDWDGFKKADEN